MSTRKKAFSEHMLTSVNNNNNKNNNKNKNKNNNNNNNNNNENYAFGEIEQLALERRIKNSSQKI